MAITVPVVTSALERRRLGWEGEQRRFDELRSLLDSAVARLIDARNLIYDGIQASITGDVEPLQQIADSYRQTTTEIMKDSVRIQLRLGERAAFAVANSAATNTCTRLEAEFDSYLKEPQEAHFPGTAELDQNIGVLMESARELIGVTA